MAGETRVAVIGHPVSHSRSPRMHTAAFQALGMGEWSYEAIDVAPERLAEFVAELPQSGLRGVNVTIPHKAAVVELCDVVSAEAVRAGSVNTLLSEPEGIRGRAPTAVGFCGRWGRVSRAARWCWAQAELRERWCPHWWMPTGMWRWLPAGRRRLPRSVWRWRPGRPVCFPIWS